MKRLATTIVTLIVIANILPMSALACGAGGGGYRPSIRPYYGPPASVYRQAPAYHQTIVRRRIVQPTIVQQPPVRNFSTQSQIRIAPSQRAQFATTQPNRTINPQPSAPATTPQPQTSTAPPVESNSGNVNSALALLAGQPASQPNSTPNPPVTTATSSAKHVGTWTANVGDSATVQLNLQADGSFQWVATNGGKQSRFDGQFTIADGTLTLARASDNQKLSGSLSFTGSGFNFKLNGAKDSGLNFTQQS